jgi:hypothetical protein
MPPTAKPTPGVVDTGRKIAVDGSAKYFEFNGRKLHRGVGTASFTADRADLRRPKQQQAVAALCDASAFATRNAATAANSSLAVQ